jgi:hypothetical protein
MSINPSTYFYQYMHYTILNARTPSKRDTMYLQKNKLRYVTVFKKWRNQNLRFKKLMDGTTKDINYRAHRICTHAMLSTQENSKKYTETYKSQRSPTTTKPTKYD